MPGLERSRPACKTKQPAQGYRGRYILPHETISPAVTSGHAPVHVETPRARNAKRRWSRERDPPAQPPSSANAPRAREPEARAYRTASRTSRPALGNKASATVVDPSTISSCKGVKVSTCMPARLVASGMGPLEFKSRLGVPLLAGNQGPRGFNMRHTGGLNARPREPVVGSVLSTTFKLDRCNASAIFLFKEMIDQYEASNVPASSVSCVESEGRRRTVAAHSSRAPRPITCLGVHDEGHHTQWWGNRERKRPAGDCQPCEKPPKTSNKSLRNP